MLAAERRGEILEKLHADKKVIVSELSQLYDVSEETIRRDLERLEKEGYAVKSYGGAVLNEDIAIDLPFNIRRNKNVSGKQTIAEIASAMVKDGDHIFLDASTTAVFAAKALKDKKNLTIVTNSVEVLIELSEMSGWNVFSTGGRIQEGYLTFSGSRCDEAIRSYYMDVAFVSCKALNRMQGMMESQEAFSTTKLAMLSSSRKKILLADSTKFDQTAFAVTGTLGSTGITTLITDHRPDEEWLRYLQYLKIECLYPVIADEDAGREPENGTRSRK